MLNLKCRFGALKSHVFNYHQFFLLSSVFHFVPTFSAGLTLVVSGNIFDMNSWYLYWASAKTSLTSKEIGNVASRDEEQQSVHLCAYKETNSNL